jgi:molybdopterin synthase sulfur carrier subunit
MEQPATATTRSDPAAATVVTVRYWAAARAAAGVVEEKRTGATLADVLEECRKAHPGNATFERVLSVCSFLVGEKPLGAQDPAQVRLRPGDTVEVLPPFAGG